MAVAPHQIHQCCQISSLIRWVNEELIATLLMEPFLAAEAGSCQQNNELYSICLHKHTVHFNR